MNNVHNDIATMRQLIASHQDGFALPRHFYVSQAVYDHDIKAYWSESWIWAGHTS